MKKIKRKRRISKLPSNFFLPHTIVFPLDVISQWDIEYREQGLKMINNDIDLTKYFEFIENLNEEIIKIGKNIKWADEGDGTSCHPQSYTPTTSVLSNVAGPIEAHIIRDNKQNAQSPVFYEFLKRLINDDRYGCGRLIYIDYMWPKTKRQDGINIRKLLKDDVLGGYTTHALLKFKDSRWVKEVRAYQKRNPNSWNKKHVALYLERYGEPTEPTSEENTMPKVKKSKATKKPTTK